MKLTSKQPVSDEDEIAHTELYMRLQLRHAKECFELAKGFFDAFDGSPEQKQELWFRFAAFERDLMKGDKGKKEWS